MHCVKKVLTFMTQCVIFKSITISSEQSLREKITNVKPKFKGVISQRCLCGLA